MHLLKLTLQSSNYAEYVVKGHFSSPSFNELIILKPNLIRIYQIKYKNKINLIDTSYLLGSIRNADVLSNVNANTDFLTITSIYGGFSIIKYVENIGWMKKYNHFFGRSGTRRVIPGYFLKNDLFGRISFIGSLDRLRFIFVINIKRINDNIEVLPIELKKANSYLEFINPLFNGFNNPVFACIESDRSLNIIKDSYRISKYCIFYEFDMGLNLLLTTFIEKVAISTHHICSIISLINNFPACLLISEKYINLTGRTNNDHFISIPMRISKAGLPSTIISSLLFQYQKKQMILLTKDVGDMFLIKINSKAPSNDQISISYFDTIVPISHIHIIRNNILIVISSLQDYLIYKIKSKLDQNFIFMRGLSTLYFSNIFIPFFFRNTSIKNLEMIYMNTNLPPISNLQSLYYNKKTFFPSIICLNGNGARNNISKIKFGLNPIEVTKTKLPSIPRAIWTIEKIYNDTIKSIIVIGFTKLTIVFLMEDEIIETKESGILGRTHTLLCSLTSNDSLIQIHKTGIRHISSKYNIIQWNAPKNNNINLACSNFNNFAIICSDNLLIYFTIQKDKIIILNQTHAFKQTILVLEISNFKNKNFLIISNAESFYILSLSKSNMFHTLINYRLPLTPYVIKNVSITDTESLLLISLKNGVLLFIQLILQQLILKTPKMKFVGTEESNITINSHENYPCFTISSNITYYCTYYNNSVNFKMINDTKKIINTAFLKYKGILLFCNIYENYFNIFYIPDYLKLFHFTGSKLYTHTNDFVYCSFFESIVIIENEFYGNIKFKHEIVIKFPNKIEFSIVDKKINQNKSLIQILDSQLKYHLDFIEFFPSEKLISLTCFDTYIKKKLQSFIAVGSYNMNNESYNVYLFRFCPIQKNLKFIHRTKIEKPPYCMIYIKNRLFIGTINLILIYSIGKKKLLKKFSKHFYTTVIKKLYQIRNKIIIQDLNNGLIFCLIDNQKIDIYPIFSSLIGKYIKGIEILDINSIISWDILGNLFTYIINIDEYQKNRVTQSVRTSYLNQKLDDVQLTEPKCIIYIGEAIAGMKKIKILPWKQEILFYFTILGTIGCLIPIKNTAILNIVKNLQYQLTFNKKNFFDSDYQYYNSYYYINKNIYDVDLCSIFINLSSIEKTKITESMNSSSSVIVEIYQDLIFSVF